MAKCARCKNQPKQEGTDLYFHCKGEFSGLMFDLCLRCLVELIEEEKGKGELA